MKKDKKKKKKKTTFRMQRETNAHTLFLYWSVGRLDRGVGLVDRQHRFARHPRFYSIWNYKKTQENPKRNLGNKIQLSSKISEENRKRITGRGCIMRGQVSPSDYSVLFQDSIIWFYKWYSFQYTTSYYYNDNTQWNHQRGSHELKQTGQWGHQDTAELRVPHCSYNRSKIG